MCTAACGSSPPVSLQHTSLHFAHKGGEGAVDLCTQTHPPTFQGKEKLGLKSQTHGRRCFDLSNRLSLRCVDNNGAMFEVKRKKDG